MKRELTLKQTAVLRAVEEFVLGQGYAPTIRGLAAALRMANPSAVFKHLQSFERKGYLVRVVCLPALLDSQVRVSVAGLVTAGGATSSASGWTARA